MASAALKIVRIWVLMASAALGSFVINADTIAGTNLGGEIVTQTNVHAYADLSLDLRDMRINSSSDEILRLYNEGHNAELSSGYDLQLKVLSKNLYKSGNSNSPLTPNYSFQLYGLSSTDSLTAHSGSNMLGNKNNIFSATASPPSSILDSHYDTFKISNSNFIKYVKTTLDKK